MTENIFSSDIEDCLETCMECARICQASMIHCLSRGGNHANVRHISLLQMCVDLCHVTEKALLTQNLEFKTVCRACADICEACAESCDGFGDGYLEDCAEICQICAESCRELLGGQQGLTSVTDENPHPNM